MGPGEGETVIRTKEFLGIFVNPIYVQNEGIELVFDNLESVGTTAICIMPYVAHPADEGKGRRYPPLHVDGYERLVARPVWGQREINLERFLAYDPDLSLYEGGPYRPDTKSLSKDVDGTVPQAMIAEAKKRGLQVHVLFHPFLPPGIRPEDQPVRVDGSVPEPPQVALNACMNSPAARTYGLALAQDLVQHLDGIDGLIPDWVEYGAYCLEAHFTCFCAHCEAAAREKGLDWDTIRTDVATLWDWLHQLSPDRLQRSRRVLGNPSELIELMVAHPGWLQFLQFKADSVAEYYRDLKKVLDDLGVSKLTLSARGWPPPWNRSSGMDYRRLAEICDAVTPKLFTFDYSVLPRWYGETLLQWNPDLSESIILEALIEWMYLPDDLHLRSFANYHIPAPDEHHPARLESYRTRLDEVVDQVGTRARCFPFAHVYLPDPQWKRMVAIIRDSPVDGMWIQMYGYLSDHKLEILKQMWP